MTAEIMGLVLAAALAHGMDGDSVLRWVDCESSGNPAAQAGQFVGLTALGSTKRAELVNRWAPSQGIVGDPTDPAQQLGFSLDVVTMQGWHDWPICGRWLRYADLTPMPRFR